MPRQLPHGLTAVLRRAARALAVLGPAALAAAGAAAAEPLRAVDLTTVVSPREACYHDGRAYSPGAVIHVPLPRGCTREGTRLLKMAETRICAIADDRPSWQPLYDIPLDKVTKEIGPDCEW